MAVLFRDKRFMYNPLGYRDTIESLGILESTKNHPIITALVVLALAALAVGGFVVMLREQEKKRKKEEERRRQLEREKEELVKLRAVNQVLEEQNNRLLEDRKHKDKDKQCVVQ